MAAVLGCWFRASTRRPAQARAKRMAARCVYACRETGAAASSKAGPPDGAVRAASCIVRQQPGWLAGTRCRRGGRQGQCRRRRRCTGAYLTPSSASQQRVSAVLQDHRHRRGQGRERCGVGHAAAGLRLREVQSMVSRTRKAARRHGRGNRLRIRQQPAEQPLAQRQQDLRHDSTMSGP